MLTINCKYCFAYLLDVTGSWFRV